MVCSGFGLEIEQMYVKTRSYAQPECPMPRRHVILGIFGVSRLDQRPSSGGLLWMTRRLSNEQ